MSELHDWEAKPVPAWAVQTTGREEDFTPMRVTIDLGAYAFSLSPDAFNFWLNAELKDVAQTLRDAYYAQRS